MEPAALPGNEEELHCPMTLRSRSAGGGRQREYGFTNSGRVSAQQRPPRNHSVRVESIPSVVFRQLSPGGGACIAWYLKYKTEMLCLRFTGFLL